MKSEFFADNPYTAADKWLLEENLPLSYRQQVVEFILQSSGKKDFALDTSYRDPYTGCKYSALQNTIIKVESAVGTVSLFISGGNKEYLFYFLYFSECLYTRRNFQLVRYELHS